MKRISKEKEVEFIASFESFSDALFRHSFFRVSQREIALDLVQDTFTKTWNHIVRGGDIQNMKSFLYQVMNNLIIDYYRKHKSSSLDILIEDGFDPSEEGGVAIIQNAEIENIKKSLSGLSEKDQEVIVMRYIDGLSLKEISDIIKESENVVSVRIHRATEKLKSIIKP